MGEKIKFNLIIFITQQNTFNQFIEWFKNASTACHVQATIASTWMWTERESVLWMTLIGGDYIQLFYNNIIHKICDLLKKDHNDDAAVWEKCSFKHF